MRKRIGVIIISIFTMIILTGIGMFTPAALNAQDTLPKEQNWEFNLAPLYLWAISMDGNLTLMGNNQPVQADFSDITDSLEKMFTVHFEGMHKDGIGFLFDITHLNVGGQETLTEPIPMIMDVDFKNTMVELAGLYRFDLDKNDLDFIAGIRYYGVDGEMDIASLPLEADGDEDWVDGMIGARYTWKITDTFDFITRGDIAFGGSDLAWNVSGLFNYQPREHLSLLFGYRYLDVDYDSGTGSNLFRYDLSMQGPMLGVNFIW